MRHVRYQQAISGFHDVLLDQTETALAIDECLEYFTEKKQKVWKKNTDLSLQAQKKNEGAFGIYPLVTNIEMEYPHVQ